MDNIQDIVNSQKAKTNLLRISLKKTDTRITISKKVMMGDPIPINILENKDMIKVDFGVCNMCKMKGNYKLQNMLFCDKHIHKSMIESNLLT
jgi:hypothetical protein